MISWHGYRVTWAGICGATTMPMSHVYALLGLIYKTELPNIWAGGNGNTLQIDGIITLAKRRMLIFDCYEANEVKTKGQNLLCFTKWVKKAHVFVPKTRAFSTQTVPIVKLSERVVCLTYLCVILSRTHTFLIDAEYMSICAFAD